jgi:hypothetical protein
MESKTNRQTTPGSTSDFVELIIDQSKLPSVWDSDSHLNKLLRKIEATGREKATILFEVKDYEKQ